MSMSSGHGMPPAPSFSPQQSQPQMERGENSNIYERIEEIAESIQQAAGEIIAADQVPVDIRDVQDDILDKVILDTCSNKKFRYIRLELEFCRRYHIPLPIEHPSIRLAEKRNTVGIGAEAVVRDAPDVAKQCSQCTRQIVQKLCIARVATIVK